MIPFNIPAVTGREEKYMKEVIVSRKLSGDGAYTKKCVDWMEANLDCRKALLTTSCTHSLEMAAILADIQEGDEVIMPSYTFVSTANAFALRGAKVVFVDIRPDTMNINELLIEDAITEKTKAIVPVHYAGVACEMDTIMDLAKKYNLIVIEDAAQGVISKYKDQYLGTIGQLGCFSFHETKNYHCGEGGALLINDKRFIERAQIIREKGTNRTKFLRGQVDKYSWVDIGSSYLPSELNAAFLYAQLECAIEMKLERLSIWDYYYKALKPHQDRGWIELPVIPKECMQNGHMFYVKLKDLQERTHFIEHMKTNGVTCSFHYVPLHSSAAGLKYGRFHGEDQYTTLESERLVRLPLYNGLSRDKLQFVIAQVDDFFRTYSQ